MKWISNFAQRA